MASFLNIRNRLWDNAQYKFSIIFCSLYVVIFSGNINNSKILTYIFISILLSIGIAGIGYAFNDIHDLENDLKNNKQNLFIQFSKKQGILLVLFFLALSIFPWFILPFNKISLLLILTEVLLFMIYALPPFRLKERGLAGVLTDSLYAQVIPCLLAVYTYIKIEQLTFVNITYILLYCLWLIILGSRNIINHQIYDYENDKNTKTNTFVTLHGKRKTKYWVLYLLIPCEFILFLLLTFYLPHTKHIFFISFLIYIAAYILMQKIKNKGVFFTDAEDIYIFLNQKIFNEFYEIHLPVFILFYFSLIKPFFVWILILNLLIFMPIYYSYSKGFIKKYLL